MAKTYDQLMLEKRQSLPQADQKRSKAPTGEPPPTDTELVTSGIDSARRRAKDRAAAKDAGVLGPLRPPKTKMPESTYRGKTPADAVPRFIETLLGEDGVERSKQEEGVESRRTFMENRDEIGIKYDYSDMLDLMRSPRILELMTTSGSWGGEAPPSSSRVSEDGLQLRGDLSIDGDDPQAIADAADDHAAQYIYQDIPGEAVPDAARLDMYRERAEDNTYQGDGPGGDGMVFFYEDPGGGNQRGYWYRDDGSTINVTNLLSPPDA